ncbi:MAG: hypothetical protein BHW33_06580 [Firmicutes bacterium CAG:137_57_8]|nr:MAG: hypothetical protein BHW33_06580 [Firmicutes bacterium CAG:137_57_8]
MIPLQNAPGGDAVCPPQANFDVQELIVLRRQNPDDPPAQKGADLVMVLRLQGGQDLQPLFPPA